MDVALPLVARFTAAQRRAFAVGWL
jgi:hypothetical protein